MLASNPFTPGSLRASTLLTWLRPGNLERPRPAVATGQCTWLTGTPDGDPAALARTLWDLPGWSARVTLELLAKLH